MVQFLVRGEGEARSFICAQTPFRIGRAPAADFQLIAPGVWDAHAEVTRDGTGRLLISPVGDAIMLVNLSGRGDKDMHTVAEKSGITF